MKDDFSYIDKSENELRRHFMDQGKPETFNEDFQLRIKSYINQYKELLIENEITDKPFTVKEIKSCISKMKLAKSPGPDLILNEIIKYSSVVTCKSLAKLFNLILETGNYPEIWRKSFTILIFKSVERSDLNNYRGISLQNNMAKLFSSLLNTRLNLFYENKFASQQFGFRANHRTTDSIFIMKTLISKYLNKKKQKIFACFVDLRKAFDSLEYNGLFYKLIKGNIGSKFYNIISDMYSCNQSAVKIDNEYSKFFELVRGVKQGDSLKPTLFNCFIYDIHDIFDNSCDPVTLVDSKIPSLSFADDLVLLSSSHSGLQNALNKLEQYCYDWQLTVNIKKNKSYDFSE